MTDSIEPESKTQLPEAACFSKNGRKRILVIVDSYLPGFRAGGPIRSVSNMVETFRQEYDFFIVTRNHDWMDNIPYSEVAHDQWLRTSDARIYYGSDLSITRLRKLIAEVSPQAIYLNSHFSPLSRGVLWLRRTGQIRDASVLLAPRGEFSPGALAIKASRKFVYLKLARLLNLYEGVIWHASTEKEREQIREQMGKVSIRVARMLSSSDAGNRHHDAVRPKKVPGNAAFVFLSRVDRMKNLDLALKMLSKLNASVTFDIYGPVGQDGYWEECRALIAEMDANVTCRYHGPVPQSEVAATLSRYHYLLLPTRGENFGHVILESLQVGTPVIISTETPWKDLQEKGIGWDLPVNEAERWQHALNQCVQTSGDDFLAMSLRATEFALAYTQSDEIRRENQELLKAIGI